MENIGDWLYVVVIIIAVISSFAGSLKKNTKKEQEQQPLPREVFRGDTFDDDFWGEPQDDNRVPDPVVKTMSKADISQAQWIEAKVHNFNRHNEGVSAISHTNTEPILMEADEEYTSVTIEDMPTDTDDWRKALVYSEVFNRKY